MSSSVEHPCVCTITLPFNSVKDAQIVVDSLSVDEVLTPKKVNQFITCNESNIVTIKIDTTDEKMLRLCVSGILDMAMVVSQTLDECSV